MRPYQVNFESKFFRYLEPNLLQNLPPSVDFCNICAMKASELILDLLRTYGKRGASVQHIAETGALFGLTGNAIRVNLSRLVNKGAIELVQRGEYRLCDSSAVVNDFAESWRLGEKRVKKWDGRTWLAIHMHKFAPRAEWVLTNHGFRSASSSLWIRPCNLSISGSDLFTRLKSLGLPDSAMMLDEASLLDDAGQVWIKGFNIEHLDSHYASIAEQLKVSMSRLESLPEDTGKKESFTLGGQAIEVVAKDPLIPEQWLDPKNRRALWQRLLEYDAAGRAIWTKSSTHVPETLITPNIKLMSI